MRERAGFIALVEQSELTFAEVRERHPGWIVPTRSTGYELLRRVGLVRQRRRVSRVGHRGPPLSEMDEPNAVCSANSKGQFKTRDGACCYPLTVADGFSRYLPCCQGLPSTRTQLVKPVFTRLFEESGFRV